MVTFFEEYEEFDGVAKDFCKAQYYPYDHNCNSYLKISGYPRKNSVVKKPKNHDKMLEIAREFSKDFIFKRID